MYSWAASEKSQLTSQNKIPALKALKRVEVPLWTAIILKSQAKCNIIAPLWLNTDYLKKMYEQEKKNLEMFSSLPWNWLEMSKILIARAADDLSDSSTQLRSIIKDLREIRQLKSKRGLRELNESNIQLNGLSLMELNELRPFALSVMEKMRQLHDSVQTTNDQASDESEPDL